MAAVTSFSKALPRCLVDYALKAAKSKAKTKPARSWTGEALAPVLEEGPYKTRKVYKEGVTKYKKNEMDIEDVGANTKMPWEADGRRWHTEDRVGREGEPAKWDGKILAEVVDKIQTEDGFDGTSWNGKNGRRNLRKEKVSKLVLSRRHQRAWFLKMQFRVRPRTFKRVDLLKQIPLKTANELDDVPFMEIRLG